LNGALAVAKYHERASYHLSQARALTRTLVGAGDLVDNGPLLAQFHQEQYREYPQLGRLRLNWLWTGLHLGIGVLLIITLA
jgi:hypothetical protein